MNKLMFIVCLCLYVCLECHGAERVGVGFYHGVTRSTTSPSGNTRYYGRGSYLGYSRPNSFKGTNYYNSRGSMITKSYQSPTGTYHYHSFRNYRSK